MTVAELIKQLSRCDDPNADVYITDYIHDFPISDVDCEVQNEVKIVMGFPDDSE